MKSNRRSYKGVQSTHASDPFIILKSLGGVWLVSVRRSRRHKYGAHWQEVSG